MLAYKRRKAVIHLKQIAGYISDFISFIHFLNSTVTLRLVILYQKSICKHFAAFFKINMHLLYQIKIKLSNLFCYIIYRSISMPYLL